MTTIRSFRCNLCGADKTNENSISGIYFASGTKIEFKTAREAENHLCDRCIKGLADALTPHYRQDAT